MENNYKRLAIIPIYLGNGYGQQSNSIKKIVYLRQTINSIKDNFETIIGVCTKEDQDLLLKYKFESILLNSEPLYLPYTLCKWAQENVKNERILYTEADHIFKNNISWEEFDSMISNDTYYLSPHRLENTYQEFGKSRGPNIKLADEKSYVAPNSVPRLINERYCGINNYYEAYGGSFYCSKNLFNNIKFSKVTDLPLEHVGGFEIFNTGVCLKTSSILDFYVIHLSAFEYHKKLFNEKSIGLNKVVSFEIAKLLKKCGFDKSTEHLYHINGTELVKSINCNDNSFEFLAPTIKEAVTWLYEKYESHIKITPNDVENDKKKEPIIKYNSEVISQNKNLKFKSLTIRKVRIEPYNSPIEAYEAAILFILNNLYHE